MTTKNLANEAISRMNKKITNEIFMIIQNDRDLMHAYLRSVESNGLDKVNQEIGKAVKKAYALDNIDDRENNPACTLIQSHQKFA